MNGLGFGPGSGTWWIATEQKGVCPRCGEDRIITQIRDANGERWYCDVCAHEWKDVGSEKGG